MSHIIHQIDQSEVMADVHRREVFARVVEAFGDTVLDTVITRTVRFPETTVAGEPITTWAPSSSGAQQYRALAKEVLAR